MTRFSAINQYTIQMLETGELGYIGTIIDREEIDYHYRLEDKRIGIFEVSKVHGRLGLVWIDWQTPPLILD